MLPQSGYESFIKIMHESSSVRETVVGGWALSSIALCVWLTFIGGIIATKLVISWCVHVTERRLQMHKNTNIYPTYTCTLTLTNINKCCKSIVHCYFMLTNADISSVLKVHLFQQNMLKCELYILFKILFLNLIIPEYCLFLLYPFI